MTRPFRLYPHRSTPRLDPAIFANPPSEYRGMPFWCWNDRLDRARLARQIDVMKRMGFGGFHVHSRTGLADEYLGTTFMNCVKMSAELAERNDMLCWLYDEDRWPSGYAGGIATREPQFRQRHLLWTRIPYEQGAPRGKSDYTASVRNETGRLVARFEVELDDTFRLARYRRLSESDIALPDPTIYHAYIEPATPSTWFNNQTALDTLSRGAVEHFIQTTHERYRALLTKGDSPLYPAPLFGSVVPAIFTDEPQFVKKSLFVRGDESHDLFMPISEDFFDTFATTFGCDLADHLPELFWNLRNDAPSRIRYQYHEHTAERFAGAFGDTLGDWCEHHGIALTGHMLGEGNLMSQTRGCGDAMRGLRSFQLPGIDMLCDKRELTTVKQAQSIAHQFDREGVVSELYGVTGWHFDFVGHKAQGDWQAALGVTIRVPHLFWMSMRGEAKRDYPASIGEQSPWFEEYKLIEDHFARVNAVMTRGTPATKVAVIHPIESAWLHWGPTQQNDSIVKRLEESFTQLPEWLLFGNVDFDYVSESMINVARASRPYDRANFPVGAMSYECLIIPPMRTMRSTTLDALERFVAAGGTVVFAGEIAPLVDAGASERGARLASRCIRLPFEKRAILDSVSRWSDVRIDMDEGSPSDAILHQLRIDGENRVLILVNTDRINQKKANIFLRGEWDVAELDTMTGHTAPRAAAYTNHQTTITHTFPPHGHLLLSLTPHCGPSPLYSVERLGEGSRSDQSQSAPEHPSPLSPGYGGEGTRKSESGILQLVSPVPITLSEPNVLLLDRARFRLSEHDPWSELTDILRIDNLVRTHCGLPPRTGRGVQPWADKSPAPVLATVQLKFEIDSAIEIDRAEIALESPEEATIRLDGKLISNVPIDWWVDQSICRVKLPTVGAAAHELTIAFPFTRKTELEACYLLGDFGVRVDGVSTQLIAPVRTLAWGDWTIQGLPFYGGNVTYHASIDGGNARLKLAVPSFSNPLLSIGDGSRCLGKIAFAPFELEFDSTPLPMRLDITAFGNRANTFGPLHHADANLRWIGPAAWRSTGPSWTDEYRLRPMGILAAPIVYAGR